VVSEKEALSEAADRFKKHEQYDDDHATLMIVGHADVRGPKIYNLRLSRRRAELVKSYLVAQGIPANKIQAKAEGKQQELNEKAVLALQVKDTQKPEKWMARRHTLHGWHITGGSISFSNPRGSNPLKRFRTMRRTRKFCGSAPAKPQEG
jgi:hypothetical protein